VRYKHNKNNMNDTVKYRQQKREDDGRTIKFVVCLASAISFPVPFHNNTNQNENVLLPPNPKLLFKFQNLLVVALVFNLHKSTGLVTVKCRLSALLNLKCVCVYFRNPEFIYSHFGLYYFQMELEQFWGENTFSNPIAFFFDDP